MCLFPTRHLADVYVSFTDQEMGRQLAGKRRLLLSFSALALSYTCIDTRDVSRLCIFLIYRRYKSPVKSKSSTCR